MSLLPITLGVDRPVSAEGTASKAKPQTEEILVRDRYTCRCCGFKSQRYQRVMPWTNAKGATERTSDTHVTVCSFCELCFTLDRAGMTGAGSLIWLPEMSQVELNHVARAIYLARDEQGVLGLAARRAHDALMGRKTEAKKRLGTDDPLLLATALFENMSAAEYDARAEKLDGIRFMPADRWLVRGRDGDIDCFPQMLAFWRSTEGPYGRLPVEQWMSRFAAVSSDA